jgi:hypothetical protein
MVLVSWVLIFTSRGSTWEYAGISNTSSKVRPSPKNLLDLLLAGELFIVAIGKDKTKLICTQKLLKIHSIG